MSPRDQKNDNSVDGDDESEEHNRNYQQHQQHQQNKPGTIITNDSK
jgi:hypothetical protein